MISIYVLSALTILAMTLSFFLFPTINIKAKRIDTYWLITTIGAIFILLFNISIAGNILNLFIQNNSTNPFKIIVLFLSLTFISKFLDAVGLFNFLASRASRIGKGNQFIIFTAFYFLISLLTIATNNDIIIIVTPIMIYFAKASKIKPMPYLIMVCFVLNTLSTTFLTTNVSNLYLGSFFGCLGLTSLILTTIFLIISNLINVEMYLITLIFALVDLIIGSVYCFIKKEDKIYILKPVKTLPYEFIPFLISMFIIISSLNQTDLLFQIGNLLNSIESIEAEVFAYGLTSAISANLVNNVPMSLLYANILNANTLTTVDNVYAAILASNLCALITPCGALSSLMFMRICKENEVKISYLDYMKFAPLGIILLVIGIGLILVF